MKRTALLMCACLLALPAIALAQEQDGMIELTPWWDRPIVRDLGLSQQQMKEVRMILRDSRDRLIQLRAAVNSADGALVDAMGEERIDADKAQASIDQVISARAELLRAVSHMSLKLRQVLTYSQWQELRKRSAKRVTAPAAKRQRNALGSPR